MHEIISIYWLIQDYITDNNLLGIPLDIVAHFLVAVILVNLLLHFKIKMPWILVTVFLIALLKEIIDWKVQIGLDVPEALKDIIVTMIYPVLLFLIRKKLKT